MHIADVVAGGIEELVRHAAQISSNNTSCSETSAKGTAPPDHLINPPALPHHRPKNDLKVMLAEMERAAKSARLPQELTTTPTSQDKCDPGLPRSKPPGAAFETTERFDNLPPIEVWRRDPKIEIYRRVNGKLKRVRED